MARCRLGPKKLMKYSNIFGIKFTYGTVRGGTDHRVDLLDNEERHFCSWPPFNELYIYTPNSCEASLFKEAK